MPERSFTNNLPWIIAASGLLATHLFSEARERRKERRAQLDKVLERLGKLEENGKKFHLAAQFDLAAARALVAEIDRLQRAVARNLPRSSAEGELAAASIEHKRSLTFENFDQGSFSSQEPGSPLLLRIESATIDYEVLLEEEYAREYPNQFPYFRVLPIRDREWRSAMEVLCAFFSGGLIALTVAYLAR